MPVRRHSRSKVPGAVAARSLHPPELGAIASQVTRLAKFPALTPGSWIGANPLSARSPVEYVTVKVRPTHWSVLHRISVLHQPLQTMAIGATALSVAGHWIVAVAEALM